MTRFATTGQHPAKLITRARIIHALATSENRRPCSMEEVACQCGVSRHTVQVAKADFERLGVDGFLKRKKRETPPVKAKADGVYEAHLIALCQSPPPEGYARWTLTLLADKSVELGYTDSITPMHISRVLKKELKPHLKKCWCIPPKENAAFVAAMEDVLEVYARPYDARFPPGVHG